MLIFRYVYTQPSMTVSAALNIAPWIPLSVLTTETCVWKVIDGPICLFLDSFQNIPAMGTVLVTVLLL